MRFSSVDGSLIDLNFITNASTGGVLQLGIEVGQVGDQIWLSDQNADSIFRFNLQGQFQGTVVGPANNLDNIRGFGVVNNILYVTNFATNNGAPGPAIRKFNATTFADLGSTFPPGVTSPWDVVEFDNSVMVSDGGTIGGSETGFLFRLNSSDGSFNSVFDDNSPTSNGLSLPKGMTVLSNGNLLVANNTTPDNIYEYTPAGVRVGTYTFDPGTSLSFNGAVELENGMVFVTLQGSGVSGNNGVYSLNRATGVFTPILLASQTDGFIPNFPNHVVGIPEPLGATGAALAGAMMLLRRGKRSPDPAAV
jgi:hypothetical protein